jgi:hypothetical protein
MRANRSAAPILLLTLAAAIAACGQFDASPALPDSKAGNEPVPAASLGKVETRGQSFAVARRDAAGREASTDLAAAPGEGDGPESGFRTPSAAAILPSMIIRTGQANVEVDSLDTAIERVRLLASRVGGFVANTSMQGGRHQLRSASLEIRLPSARFDDAVSGLTPLGKVESVNVQAEDVGEEFVDVQARVGNAHRLEERLIALLATRTGRLRDVLEVEHELARVREEIERYEGRLRYLRTRTSISTLTVNVHEPVPIISDQPNPGAMSNAFREAWRRFVALVAGMIAMSGVGLPMALVLGGAWWVWRRRRGPVDRRGGSGGGSDGPVVEGQDARRAA